jgi:type IV pilus assembly protein PilA
MFKKFFKSFKYGQKGFTLIELLVVVAILGVLAAVAIPNVGKFIGKGKVEAANTEFATVQTAVAAYQADNKPAITESATPVSVTAYTAGYIQNTLVYSYLYTYVNGELTISGDDTCAAAVSAGLYWNGGKWSLTNPNP